MKRGRPKKNREISEVEFWDCINASYGIFARAVRIIEKKYNIKLSRQAVRARAMKDPERLNECRETMIDDAEQTLIELTRNAPPSVKLGAIQTMLKGLGRNRGWGDKLDIDATVKVEGIGEIIKKTDRYNPKNKEEDK